MGKKKSWKRKRARRDNRDEPEQIAKRRKLAGDTGEYRSNRGWSIQPTSNGKFEEYYKEQNIIPEEEWDEFLKTCRVRSCCPLVCVCSCCPLVCVFLLLSSAVRCHCCGWSTA